MLNRAKGMINRVQNRDNIKEAIVVFEKWMNNYKQQNGGAKLYLVVIII